jgi:hypothetical protein
MKLIFPLLLLFVVLAVLSAHVNLPWSDEAWFASPALNLDTHGNFGTSVLDQTASFRQNNLTGITRHTYWIMPLYPLVQAAWYPVVGFSLLHLRYLSIFWGLVALGAWYRILLVVSKDSRVAILAVGLLAADFTFIWCASVGRMDMMAAALGSAGIAAYLSFRETHFLRAVIVSQACVAAAGMSHPQALGYFAGLLVLTLYSDWRRIRPVHVLAAAAPYLICAVGWGLYILRAPHEFMLQFGGNAAGRGVPLNHPLALLQSQFVHRFWWTFGMAPNTQGLSHIKLFVLAAYAAGIFSVLFISDIRQHPGYRALLLTGGATLLVMMAIDSEAQSHYVIHFVLWMAACTAIATVWFWDHRPHFRRELFAILVLLLLVQLATTGRRLSQRAYETEYLPVATYLQAHAQSKDIIMASSELAFQLGYVDNLVDDPRLGFRSGKRPNFIVIDKNRYEEWIPQYELREPATFHYIQDMMHEFHPVLSNDAYHLYARNGH